VVYAFGREEHHYSGTGTNQWNTYYYFLGNRLIGDLDANGTFYLLTDALGSILSDVSWSAGGASIKASQVFGPYGNARGSQGTFNTAKGFTGQYNDPLTGLDYYVSRYYDPVVGVFLSADKKQGNLQGMDPYTYVGGNPETRSDPTGQLFIGDSGGTPPSQSPPHDDYWNDPSPHIPNGYGPSYSGGPSDQVGPAPSDRDPFGDPWKWKPLLALIKGALGISKFYIDASVLDIAAAKYADLFAAFDTYLPAIDDPAIIAILTGLSKHPSGVFQSQLPSGMKALAEGVSDLLGVGLNIVAGVFSGLDLAENIHNHDYTSAGIDILNIVAVTANLLGWVLDNEFLSALGSKLGLVVFSAQLAAWVTQRVVDFATATYNYSRSHKDQGNGGGGFPPFPPPPLIPNYSDPYA